MELTFKNALTDEAVAEAVALEGTPLRIEQWNQEATLDTIRHYAWGIGDNNPLYCDEDYAARGRFGSIVAPPSFLHSVYSGDIGLGLKGIQPVHAGYKWEYFHPLRRGDRIRVDARVGPTKVLSGRHCPKFIMQTTQSEFYRHDGELVARSECGTFRIPRAQADGGLSYEPREPRGYTAEELDEIRLEAVAEHRQGPEHRYWEDVSVGDQLPRLVKGPIDLMTMLAYYAGRAGSPGMKGVEMKWLYSTWARTAPERLPNNYDTSFFEELVQPSLGHVRDDVARQVGMRGAYANGGQRASWLSHLVTNWMGDHGDLCKLEIRLKRPDVFGDTVHCVGEVTAKSAPNLVSLAIRLENRHDGEVTAEASAEVRLPTRS